MTDKPLNTPQALYTTHVAWYTKVGKILGQGLMYGVLLIGALISLFPFYFAFIAATHKSDEVLASPPNLLPGGDLLKNLDHLMTEVKFGDAMFNSACIAVIYTFLGVLVCSLAGYAFAKYSFVLRDTIFLVFLGSSMLPAIVTFVPLFKLISSWTWPFTWLGSWWTVILPTLASPFGIFLMRQAIATLPNELLDAGRLDGAGEFGTFWRIVLPVVKPSLAALAILMFMT
jgi:lactose/L-arabinose transport system permease protein